MRFGRGVQLVDQEAIEISKGLAAYDGNVAACRQQRARRKHVVGQSIGFDQSSDAGREQTCECRTTLAPRHVEHAHARVFSRIRLKVAGVPLKSSKKFVRKHSLKGKHAPRPHLAYLNKRKVELVAQHPHMTPEEVRAMTMREWKAGTAPVVARSKKARGTLHKIRKCISGTRKWASSLSDKWPLSEQEFLAALRKVGNRSGVAPARGALRSAAQAELFVGDKGAISEDDSLVLRLCCSSLHPGLCCGVHRDIYDRALTVAADIEFWVRTKKDKVEGNAFRIGDSSIISSRQFVYVCHHRPRKLTVQTTVALAKLEKKDSESVLFSASGRMTTASAHSISRRLGISPDRYRWAVLDCSEPLLVLQSV